MERVRKRVSVRAALLAAALALVCAFLCAPSAWASQFADVPDDHWAQVSGIVDRSVEEGLIKGVDNPDGTVSFQPDAQVTRAQVATILARLAGEDLQGDYPENATSWTDAPSHEWFTGALNWAEQTGILKGADGRVRPYDPVSRQELAAMVARFAETFMGVETVSDTDRLGKYADRSSIDVWAEGPVSWAAENGIMGATPTINARNGATRAETAKMVLVLSDGGVRQPDLLKSHFLAVGQSDATFVELPGGTCLLIDAGSAANGPAVVKYVKSLGYTRIDYVVATCADANHVGGMAAVAEAFAIGTVYAPPCAEGESWEGMLDTLNAKATTVTRAVAGKGWSDGAYDATYSATFVAPDATVGAGSAVLHIDYAGKTFLFTGDATADALAQCTPGHVDVLKVSDHGSDAGTNEALVAQATPNFSIISCGAAPSDNVLSLLTGNGFFRTDIQGTISGFTDASSIWFDKGPLRYEPPVVEPEPEPVPPVVNPEPEPVPPGPDLSATVCVTKSGKSYHYDWCPTLSRSKNLTYMSAGSAQSRGYRPCKVCKPPHA